MLKKSWIYPVYIIIFTGMVSLALFSLDGSRLKNFFDLVKIELRAFFHKEIKDSDKSLASNQPYDRIIDTSLLPLHLRYVANLKSAGMLGDGGSIYVDQTGILVMDRLGQFWNIDFDGDVKKLNIKTINNHEIFTKEFPEKKIHSGVLKATSFIYDENLHKLYVAHNKYLGSNRHKLLISVADFNFSARDTVDQVTWNTLFESDVFFGQQEATHGSGGKILLQEDEIYLTVGFPIPDDVVGKKAILDTGLDKTPAQNPTSQLGKVLRINRKTGAVDLFTLGHRNPQGLALTNNGRLLLTEHGPQGGDELNFLSSGGNYGWPIKTFGTRYGTYDYDWPEYANQNIKKRFKEPLFAFVPSIGISPVIQTKSFSSRWKNDILVGALKAQSLFRLHFGENQNIVYSEPIWIGHRVRDIFERDSKIYLLTDDPFLIEISVDKEKLNKNTTKDDLYFSSEAAKKCIVCHSFGQTTPSSSAPSLQGVVGRKIATDSFIGYSDSFKKSNIVWTKQNLKEFLVAPSKSVPGTTMPNIYLTNKEIDEVVEILSHY